MKIKHKVQRKLDPTFQAELKLCSLCGPTPWWQGVVCAGSEDWPWRWCQVHIWLLGQRRVGCQPFWPPAGSAVLLPETWRWWAGCGWRCCVPGSGAEHSTPQSAGPPQKGTQAPGSPLLLSEPCFHSARIRAPFDFVFLSQTVVPKIANLRNH